MYSNTFLGIENLYGKQKFEKIKNSHILVIGIGGVGSWAAESLARSGVSNITLMDMDEICISNINRQVHADTKTIGKAKIDIMYERLMAINPELNCHKVFDFYSKTNFNSIVNKNYDFIIDAIDSVKSKALLIDTAFRNNIPIITIGASGSRFDPTKIRIADLNKSINDKLLKQLKRRLRRDYSFSKFVEKPFKVPAVFSSEEINEQEPPIESEDKFQNIRNCQSGLGSTSFVTASFGMAAVSYVINQISRS